LETDPMKKDRKAAKRHTPDDEDIAPDVHQAAKSLGWVVPQSEEDVLQAERELSKQPAALPEELQDPKEVFERGAACGAAESKSLEFPPDPDIDATLNRAAREGGRITPEIEERMRQDREAAERNLENEKNQKKKDK
jgi:hypothetical protein